MKISTKTSKEINKEVFENARCKYTIAIPTVLIDFLSDNSDGKPKKKYIEVDGETYCVRRFLSLDPNSEYYIEKPLDYFLSKTKKRIIPIGVDEGSNYYCMNIENGKVYFWASEEDKYFAIANSIEEFYKLFD